LYSLLDPNQFSNEETYIVPTNVDRFNKQIRNNNIDDRPITPMRGTYRQIADKFVDDDGLLTDPNLTNQYYEAYNDFEKEDDHSPTRDKLEKEFYDQVCRSFNGQNSTLKSQRTMSASQRSTINSLSRTIDPRYQSNPIRQSKYLTSSRTIASTRKQPTTIDDHNMTLKDNPTHDAFGPLAKDRKITSLRT
jgi:recombination DNA repair RAD52 pathway protein